MARAIVRNPHVLLMDEATASIDERTDALIQTMIKTQFTNTTVITIAHRLNTLIQFDKIMVLEKGKVAQFGKPIDLLKEEGILSTLVKGNGKEYERRMIMLAENKDLILEEGVEIDEEENDDKDKIISYRQEGNAEKNIPEDEDDLYGSLLSIGDMAYDDGRSIPLSQVGKKYN
jgi:ABC-type multidrug transport system ATPase subunit